MVTTEDATLVKEGINHEGNGLAEQTIEATTGSLITTGNKTPCRAAGTTTILTFHKRSINNHLGKWRTINTHSLTTTTTQTPQSHLQSIAVHATHLATLLGNVIRDHQHNMAPNFPFNVNLTKETRPGKPRQLQSSLNSFPTPTSSLFSIPLSFSSYCLHALVDTGDFKRSNPRTIVSNTAKNSRRYFRRMSKVYSR